MRNLILVLGDQLDLAGAALRAGDPALDQVLMIETLAEARHVWSHGQRVVLFLTGSGLKYAHLVKPSSAG